MAGRRKELNAWESTSDLMMGLMMIFMFISLAFLFQLESQKEDYLDTKRQIYTDLSAEFSGEELESWGAEFDKKTMAIWFKEPEVLFGAGSSDITQRFQSILVNFFPRYIAVLNQEKYRGKISEIRIEGYSSPEWGNETNFDIVYFNNMKLSQDRARSVLEYLFTIPTVQDKKQWLIENVTANGYSYSKGRGDAAYSRRVEFRVMTNDEQELEKIYGKEEF